MTLLFPQSIYGPPSVHPHAMQEEHRNNTVQPGTDITSVWAIPDQYQPGQSNAVILAHGAGNDMTHPFMSYFHHAFAAAGLLSIKFNFPYTEQGRKAPDRAALLEQTWRAIHDAVTRDALAPNRLFLAGKSMGGRVASVAVANGLECAGLIFLGYPLHPPKQPEKARTEHWPAIHCPALFLQGTRDSLCDLALLKLSLPLLPGPVTLKVIEGGDHSFKVPRSLQRSQASVFEDMSTTAVDWMNQVGG